MQKVKVTKKERKVIHKNAMVLDSMRNGQVMTIGDREYVGALPEFEIREFLGQRFVVKTHKGVPFVRVN